MTLEENIKAILECNFSIARDEVIDSATKRIMEQISRQNPLEEELEKIKAEINKCPIEVDYPDIFINQEYIYKILNNHISELKGENK